MTNAQAPDGGAQHGAGSPENASAPESLSAPAPTSAPLPLPLPVRAPAAGTQSGAVIGLDIGGTKTHGVRFEGGVAAAEYTTGSANVQNVTPEQAAANLDELFSRIGDGPIDQVYAGAGGIDTQEDAAALTALIRMNAPAALITVVHDSRLLLAAGRSATGVAVIAGTGSAAWGRNARGEEARAGGWGYLLGDEGSGYWLGREAVRYSLRRMNQGAAPDQLTTALLASCGLDEPGKLIALFHSGESRRRFWAEQARLVVAAANAGHQGSRDLLQQAGQDLAGLAYAALSQLGIRGPVILGGGLGTNVELLQDAFRERLDHYGIIDVRILDQEPVFGVLELLREPA